MALGANLTPRDSLLALWQIVKQQPLQVVVILFIVMCVGGSKKFQSFPIPWIAGQSTCRSLVYEAPQSPITGTFVDDSQNTYTAMSYLKVKPNCVEKAGVFAFVDEKFTITTANLVFFGIAKAVMNFVTGVAADKIGRRNAIILGWIFGLPMPFMVIYASDWWSVAFSSLFLGIQQALVWSSTIFFMIDLVGQKHSGAAIGVNETIGYSAQAICTVIASAILNEKYPREDNYWVLLGIIVVNIFVAIFLLKESKPKAKDEEDQITGKDSKFDFDTTLEWPSGRKSNITVQRSAFVYTSFVNTSLVSICFAGLMINFLSGFAFSLMIKWTKNGSETGLWAPIPKEDVANISLCYGIFKGVLQFICGWLGDRVGRRNIIVAGLLVCVLGMCIFVGVGATLAEPLNGFLAASSILGIGTALMYSSALAAIVDHSDPTWRSSALGAYRFWRDLGYAIGALITGAIADWIGILWAVGVAAILTAFAALFVFIFYEEVDPNKDIYNLDGTVAAKTRAIDEPLPDRMEYVATPAMPAQMMPMPQPMMGPVGGSPMMMDYGQIAGYPAIASYPPQQVAASGFGVGY